MHHRVSYHLRSHQPSAVDWGSRAQGIFFWNIVEIMLGATLKLMLIRRLLNLVGGILTLGSIAIPWAVVGGNITVSVFQPNAFVWFVPWMILAGGTTSMVSRYGGLLTIAALVSYSVSPPIYFLSTGGPAITSVFGIGFWLAW